MEGSRGSGFYGRSVAAKRVSFSLGEEEANLHKGVAFENYLRRRVSFKTNYGGGHFWTWVPPLTLAGSLNRQ